MAILRDILYKVSLMQVQGSLDVDVKSIAIDSRKLMPGSLFIAVKGVAVDGHQFVAQAIAQGAVAIIVEDMPAELAGNVTYIQVKNSSEAAGYTSANFYNNPSTRLKLVGVTGTNGKTTIATLLFKLFSRLGYTCGLISTVQNQVADNVIPATHTTPDAVSLNALLADMLQQGCAFVFMEVSSHAIHQHRVTGLSFAGGIFSNITHDHLDYHKTFDEYIRVKKSFFDHLPSTAFAITNYDDKRGPVMLQNTHAGKFGYGLKTPCDFKGKILENSLTGLYMSINEKEVHFRLIGEFNAYNLLAVYATAVNLGEPAEEVLRVLSDTTGAEGRFDYIISKKQIIGIVDYAHTPDALDNVLATIRKLKKGEERVITVVGCGGDRDKTKRPVMGEYACEQSDKVVFTSDNPRSEDPQAILDDITHSLNSAGRRKSVVISDRKEAIKMAVDMAKPGDIILVAGKGHEKYQEIKGVKYPFDDKAVLKEMFELYEK